MVMKISIFEMRIALVGPASPAVKCLSSQFSHSNSLCRLVYTSRVPASTINKAIDCDNQTIALQPTPVS